jgi:L-asparaginase / beta-aspartyl-peptidase
MTKRAAGAREYRTRTPPPPDGGDYALLVHGGAGRVPPAALPGLREGVRTAARAGWRVLAGGGSALDAAQAAVEALEMDGRFNAGRGAVARADGRIEHDAAVMDGATLRAGAIAAVPALAHPVRAARAVLEDGRHVLLAGPAARDFALLHGIATAPSATGSAPAVGTAEDTVGAVARDARGHLAAATSTGGTAGALPGRVGDAPVPGAGTYASAWAAVSCTGPGECMLRAVLAARVADRIAAGHAPPAAVRWALARVPAPIGLIVVDRRGRIARATSAEVMPSCAAGPRGVRAPRA